MNVKKSLYISSTIISACILLFTGCVKEEPIEVDAHFTIANEEPYLAGSPLTLEFSGKGEMTTLYMGHPGHEYKNFPDDTGVEVTEATYIYKYYVGGTYTVTCICSSYGNWGQDSNRSIFEKTITVIDTRSRLLSFKVSEPKLYTYLDKINFTITIRVPEGVDISQSLVSTLRESPEAKVFWGNTEIEDKVTKIDFTEDNHIRCVAPHGEESIYTVILEKIYE